MSPSEQKLMMCTLPESAAKQQLPIPPSAEVTAEASKRRAFRAYDWASAVKRLTTISPTTKLVATALADHANARTGQCNPSHKTIAAEIGVNRIATISDAITALADAEALSVRHGYGNRVSYTLLALDAPGVKPELRAGVNPDLRVGVNPILNNEENNEENSGGDGVETTREPTGENTTTHVLQDVGTQEKVATTRQRSLLAELAEERAAETLPVATFAEANREIKRLLALPRVEMMPCTGGDSDDPCGKPARVTKEMKRDAFAWVICDDCRAGYEEAARIWRSTSAAPKPEPDPRPLVTCEINGCSQRFRADEGEDRCPYCRARHRELLDLPDEIPGFGELELAAAV